MCATPNVGFLHVARYRAGVATSFELQAIHIVKDLPEMRFVGALIGDCEAETSEQIVGKDGSAIPEAGTWNGITVEDRSRLPSD